MADQGKNKRRQLEIEDTLHGKTLSVDSREECDFINWCCEAAQLSIIQDFKYQPGSFKLFEGHDYIDIDGKKRCLFRDHVYSPDFIVSFDPTVQKTLAKEFKVPKESLSCTSYEAYIDTKGTFNQNARTFAVDRKWVWQKFGIYINEVIPKKFFAKFGVPIKSFITAKTKKARKMFAGLKSLKQIFFGN